MASAQLPTPGRLILENITLLAGSPTAFHARYGFTLTPTTFSKPGNTAPANAVLHFLISIIDADVADSLFKPCFPILDRDQERDFRKVVDARLAILERTKLIPAGCARRSVVSAAGGDRFLDLLWSLSSLALQQACLRHPAYASVSRMRLLSQAQSDTSSQYSYLPHPASRSSRSLLSARSSRSERPPPDPSRHRRFLGVGMLSASQQRQRDAEQMRARIDSERIALNRTTEMGQQGAKTWASEADSLRERICGFEAKLRRLKGQLADMGFDENGNDLRQKTSPTGDSADINIIETKTSIDGNNSGGPLIPSPSGDDLLKTSPIESTESCSSVDDAGDACEDLAADLSRLLAFTVESAGQRVDVEDAVEVEKPEVPFAIVSSTSLLTGIKAHVDEVAQQSPKDIVELVKVATDELEEATNRMHEIREARNRAWAEPGLVVETDRGIDGLANGEALEPLPNGPQQGEKEDEKDTEEEQESEPSEKTATELSEKVPSEISEQTASQLSEKPVSELSEKPAIESTAVQEDDNMFGGKPQTAIDQANEPQLASEAEDANVPQPVSQIEDDNPNGENEAVLTSDVEDSGRSPRLDIPPSLEQKVSEVLAEHSLVVASSRRLQKEAAVFTTKAVPSPSSEDGNVLATLTTCDTFVEAISKPHWYSNAVANSGRGKKNLGQSSATKKYGKPPRGHASTLSDVSVAAKAMQGYGASYPSRVSIARRRKEGTRSLDSIRLDSIDKRSSSSPGHEMDGLCSPSESNSSLKGTPRSVRFAELPPSYSASRTSDNSRESSPIRNRGDSNEQFMESVSRALECHNENKEPESHPAVGKEHVGSSILGENAESELQPKEEISSPVSKKGSRPLRKYEGVLRPDLHTMRTENGRTGTVSSQKPPRVQRARTTHRVVRSQDIGQRPVASRQHSSSNTQSAQPFSSRSVSADSITSFRTSRSSANAARGPEPESSVRADSTELDEKPNSPGSQGETPNQVCCEKGPTDAKCRTHSLHASTEKMVADSICPREEPVQKKLFMTPESAVSSKTTRHLSRLTRRASTGTNFSGRSNASSHSNISKACQVTAVVKEASAEFPSVDEEELLFSPASNPPLPEKSAATRVDSGFFAGQTAQWQQSVRAQSNIGQRTAASSGRMSENSGRPGRNPGKAASSGMKSRVQSLRARLAALK